MLSVRILFVLLLSVALQGCSLGVSEIFSAAGAVQETAEKSVTGRVKTVFKFQGRLKTDAEKTTDASS